MSNATPRRILLVEDETELRETFAAYLTEAGYLVEEAENGAEGLLRLRGALGAPGGSGSAIRGDAPAARPGLAPTATAATAATASAFDLVVTDMQMPVMTGTDMIIELSRLAPWLPVLVMTGFGDKELVIRLLRVGVSDYLDKPLAGPMLVQRVDRMLAVHRDSKPPAHHLGIGTRHGGEGREAARGQHPREALGALRAEMESLITARTDQQMTQVLEWIQGGFRHRFNQPLTVQRANLNLLRKIMDSGRLRGTQEDEEMVREVLEDLDTAALCISDLLTMIGRLQGLRFGEYLDDVRILDFEASQAAVEP